VAKEVRHTLTVERPKTRKRIVARLSRKEETRLITHAYCMKGTWGLLIKTLFQTVEDACEEQASTRSVLILWVEAFESHACILGGKLPVNTRLFGMTLVLPRFGFLS